MEIIYSEGWFRFKKKHLAEYSAKKAEKLHNERQSFCVVIKKENNPYCFIEFNNEYIYVGFLDDLKREYLGYEFTEVEPGKIFLKEAQFWEYEGDTDNEVFSTRYRFNQDGEFGIEKKDIANREVERLTAQDKIDVTPLYEDYPEFGKYDAIIKKEREIPTTITT